MSESRISAESTVKIGVICTLFGNVKHFVHVGSQLLKHRSSVAHVCVEKCHIRTLLPFEPSPQMNHQMTDVVKLSMV